MLNFFNNIKDPRVQGEIDVYDFLDRIKNPDPKTKKKIELARWFKSQDEIEEYQKLKAQLTCFTLNFSFNERKNNRTIKEPTGFIYIDVDDNVNINLKNKLIFASWLSLSGKGRGVLVKVDNLTLENFATTYFDIANQLNIEADLNAGKATQYCIHSFDEDVHIYDESITYQAKDETIITPTTQVYKKKEKEDITVMGVKQEWVYDNINNYEFGDNDYLYFPDEYEFIAEAYIPSKIPNGKRNQTIYSLANQLRALNPSHHEEAFKRFILNINRSRCETSLEENEVLQIISKILNNEDLVLLLNRPRRIIFNPKSNLTRKEKMIIMNKLKGQKTIEKTKKEIEICLFNWDIDKRGKVTQKKLAEVSKKNIKTIEKYYKNFKQIIQGINQHHKKT